MLNVDAYAADCRLFGRADLGDGRLTDQLNATRELSIEDVRLESLDDGHAVEADEITVTTDELCAVVASGPRGEPARRVRTHTTRVMVDLGPYVVVGLVHSTPAADPLSVALRRAAWLPLTQATVTYRRGPDQVTDEVETLIVNRTLAALFQAVEEESAAFPWEEPRAPDRAASRALDLTASLGDPDFPVRDE